MCVVRALFMSQKLLSHPKSRPGLSLSQVSSLCWPGQAGLGLGWVRCRETHPASLTLVWHSSRIVNIYTEINVRTSWTNVIDAPALVWLGRLDPVSPRCPPRIIALSSELNIISKPPPGNNEPINTNHQPIVNTVSGIAHLSLHTVFFSMCCQICQKKFSVLFR